MPEDLVALDLAWNPLGENGASMLADSPNVVGLVALGLCGTRTGDTGVSALACSPHLKNLRSLDLRNHCCWPRTDRDGEDRGGIGELSRSTLLSQLRRILLTSNMASNGWTDEVLSIVRPPRRQTVAPCGWVSNLLRKSRYLLPSQLNECDAEELWWLGDTTNRVRLPVLTDDHENWKN